MVAMMVSLGSTTASSMVGKVMVAVAEPAAKEAIPAPESV